MTQTNPFPKTLCFKNLYCTWLQVLGRLGIQVCPHMLNPQLGELEGLSASRPEKSPKLSPPMDNDEAQWAADALLPSDDSPVIRPLHSALQQGNDTLHGKKWRQPSSAATAETALLGGSEADQLVEEGSVLKRVHEEKSKVPFNHDLFLLMPWSVIKIIVSYIFSIYYSLKLFV
jgi:hypothetical protein